MKRTTTIYHQYRSVAWLSMLICISFSAWSQEAKTVTGKVVGEAGETLPGVNVILKSSTYGTITDLNGEYSLDVSGEDAVLVFTYIGYLTKEVPVGNQQVINVDMQVSNEYLDEVVVVGYGTQKKANLTGAVSSIDSRVIENRPVSDLANAMQGTMPGVSITRTGGQPGSEGTQIQIRGFTSANGNVDPLLLVDGIAVPIFTLQTINPNDVDNISILKDASAAAIYGAQAAGGVILITTKGGKATKPRIEYSNLFGIDWALNLPKRMPLLEEAEYSNLARANAGAPPEYSQFDLDNIKNGVEYMVHPTLPGYYLYYNRKDHIKETLRDFSSMQNHNLSVSGGTDFMNYNISLGYYDKGGIFKVGPDGLKRYNARVNVETHFSKYLSLDSRIAYTLQKQEMASSSASGTGLLFQTYTYRQQYPIFTPEGRLNGYGLGNFTYADLLAGGYNNTDRNFFDGVFSLKAADFVKGLQIRAVYGKQYRRTDNYLFRRTVELYGITQVLQYRNNPNSYRVVNQLTNNNNVQFLIDYDFSIASRHNFHLLGGYQWEDSRDASVTASASNLVSNDLPSLNFGNIANKVATESINTYAYQSYFGRLNYNFDDKYLVEVTVRADESSRLAPGQRMKIFPAGSVGWNVHREEWFPKGDFFLTAFKLRGSWGQLGSSIGVGNYGYLNLLSYNSGLVLGGAETNTTYFYQGTVPSSNLAWETLETANGGVDLGLFDNRLAVTFDYYVKNNRGMFTALTLPSTFGVTTPRINNGELRSWGWELEARYRGDIGKNINYSVGLNLSDNQNKVISYAGQRVILPGYNQIIEGYPLNTFWGYQTDGYFSTKDEADAWAFQNTRTGAGDVKYLDQNGDQLINGGRATPEDHGDLVSYGSDQPRYLFGLTGSMSWKNAIDVSFFFQGVNKRTFYPNSVAIMPMAQAYVMPMDIHRDYWTESNPNAAFPRPYLQGNHNFLPADKWMLNGQYIRLKNFQVGYTFSNKLMERIDVSKLRIFVSGQDLLTFSKLGIFESRFNPESKGNGAAADYPFFATLSMGLNVTF